MLYFVCYETYGFVMNLKGAVTTNVREAFPFPSYLEADDFGRQHSQGVAYAILSNCFG